MTRKACHLRGKVKTNDSCVSHLHRLLLSPPPTHQTPSPILAFTTFYPLPILHSSPSLSSPPPSPFLSACFSLFASFFPSYHPALHHRYLPNFTHICFRLSTPLHLYLLISVCQGKQTVTPSPYHPVISTRSASQLSLETKEAEAVI